MSTAPLFPPQPAGPPSVSPSVSPTAPGDRTPGVGASLGRLLSFRGRNRVLHATWLAFFLTFVVWFNYAPFALTIADQFGLTKEQMITLGLANVALTVPARIFIGMALDRWGPRRVYSAILVYAGVPCIAFALSTSFSMLLVSRLMLSIVGAGFVVGIRMISEWFPPRDVGMAEGIYGGWGNFGAAVPALLLPMVAAWIGGPDGWRWAIATTGVLAMAYGVAYLRLVTDTPEGVAYARPRRQGALEVTSRGAVWALMAAMVPLSGALVLIVWRIHGVGVLGAGGVVVALVVIAALLAFQLTQVVRVNGPALRGEYPGPDRYPFSSVVILALSYLTSFGGELAVVSMLPAFFAQTWGLSEAQAGIAASGYAFMNLLARPAGGMMSDRMGSRRGTLSLLLGGMVVGYTLLASMGRAWPWVLAVVATMACSFFVQATNGAVYAVVPLVKKRVSGQVSGIVGAYGNVGALVFLTASLYVSPTAFFLIIAASSVVSLVLSLRLREPANSFHHELLVDEADPVPECGPGDVALEAEAIVLVAEHRAAEEARLG